MFIVSNPTKGRGGQLGDMILATLASSHKASAVGSGLEYYSIQHN